MEIKEKIHMVDLISQYQTLKPEIDQAIQEVCTNATFVNGPSVKSFEKNLAQYLDVKHVIACANGTDALQIALMALGLEPGDEVIVPAFTYVATAEVIGLLNLIPVMVDVQPDTFNTTVDLLENALTEKTKAIVPVHLFGQSADMEAIVEFAKANNLFVIEDNAQAIGADYTFSDGTKAKTGTIGDIGTTSFFPSKNLGCYGDGGAIFTNNDELATKIRMIANHGQTKRYYHSVIGCNSRLDSIQAAVLDIKLKHLDQYSGARIAVADKYDKAFDSISELQIPFRAKNSTHVFHQYTLVVQNGKRDELIEYLKSHDIPCGVYYPVPLYKQEAFSKYVNADFALETTEQLCKSVISLPIHTEMKSSIQDFIIEKVRVFFGADYFIHETAVVDKESTIGAGTKIWHFSHIMSNCTIGKRCNIGQNVVVSPEVVLGDNVKVQNNVSIYSGVTCEDDVFLGPSMVFTNIINPRSAVIRRDQFIKTNVKKGASIGANATIICGNDIGAFAFIGAGAVVTHSVPDYALVIGNPAKQVGWMSEYGEKLNFDNEGLALCPKTNEKYILENNQVHKLK